MQVAIITQSKVQVEVIAVNGGWTTVKMPTGETIKIRNGALSGHTTMDPIAAPTTAKLVIAKARKSAATTPKREKLPLEERKNGKVDPLYLQFYTGYTTVTKAGAVKRSIDKGDALALQLRALELSGVYVEVAKIVGLSKNDLVSRFAHLNNGMQRMSLGNMARKYLKEAA
jgi:branched-subunit amino acid permease